MVYVLGLHQIILQADGWESFLSNGDNKNNLIVLFVKFSNHQKVKNTASILLDMLLFIFAITCVRLPTAQKFKLL